MPELIDVVGAVLVRDGLVLAAQRGPGMALADHWEFPGGKIEPGESAQEALVRELREELLCDAEIGERIETTSHTYEFGTIRLTTFFATLISGEPRATEHAALRWVPISDLPQLEWAPADVPAVGQLIRMLG